MRVRDEGWRAGLGLTLNPRGVSLYFTWSGKQESNRSRRPFQEEQTGRNERTGLVRKEPEGTVQMLM